MENQNSTPVSRLDKSLQSMEERMNRLSKFTSRLENKVLHINNNFTLEVGSEAHFRWLDVYIKLLRAQETFSESIRKVMLLQKEIIRTDGSSKDADEVYRMIKSLSPEEIATLKASYHLMSTPPMSNDTFNPQIYKAESNKLSL